MNFIDISAKGGPKDSSYSLEEIFSKVKSIFNNVIKAEDVGFLIQKDFENKALSVSLQSGDGTVICLLDLFLNSSDISYI